MRYTRLKHQFVAKLPTPLEPGVLYVSIEYATAAHLCCCGCGVEVVTPLTPTDWEMTFDGETISLWPSVGNWNDECRSHYIIERNQVITALPWSEQRIEAEWQRNRAAKERHYSTEDQPAPSETPPPAPGITAKPKWRDRINQWFSMW